MLKCSCFHVLFEEVFLLIILSTLLAFIVLLQTHISILLTVLYQPVFLAFLHTIHFTVLFFKSVFSLNIRR